MTRPLPFGTPVIVKALNEHEGRHGVVVDCPPATMPGWRDRERFVRFTTATPPAFAWLPVSDLHRATR